MDLWAAIKTKKTEIKDSSEYLTSNYLTKNWSVNYLSDKIQDPFFAFYMGKRNFDFVLLSTTKLPLIPRGKSATQKSFVSRTPPLT
jgi:hypothetical protein